MTTTPGPAADGSDTPVALIPLRTGGKSRLGEALAHGHRADLVLAMLDDVLAALRGAGLADVRVLAGDAGAATAAIERGLPAIPDPAATGHGPGEGDGHVAPGDRSLRAAVDAALAAVGDHRPRLVVAADLPRLSADEVQAADRHPAEVVVVPTSSGGTALLRLAAGVTLPARYGPGSAGAHLAEAQRAGRSVVLLDLPGARHDVDGAQDLAALGGELDGPITGAATAAFLADLHG